jgi:hypothetical protein
MKIGVTAIEALGVGVGVGIGFFKTSTPMPIATPTPMDSGLGYFRSSSSCAFGAPMGHEKTIAQSRDRQGADPLANARGSVHTSIFEADLFRVPQA